ncbi:GNAT family N-acetyltransferase [Clostridium sp. SHJSY1]|uniref:GNAT family N-acetyltransferase n=1 Tax=Clostridium sp. SHJSY1 TaxID=2942483 RepID=UPI002876DBCD|nr:GNAT family N-acetyltransferase [Clostridium sp. SHJSY1]MDS0527076.1 GNAT family N-acetyltransferase [Clostridium sp. SHJSY1]
MIRINETQIGSIAKLLADCFVDDSLVIMETKGIDNGKVFLEKLLAIQLPAFIKTMDVSSLDDKLNSVIISYEKNNYSNFRMLILNLLTSPKVLRVLEKEDLKVYSSNIKNVSKVINLKWQNEFIKGNYYYIKAIAIENKERGKGVFRKLITPTLNYCNENNIPIILESNSPNNIPIYQHYGFKLVKTIAKDGIDLKQYCFIKYPN